jgi:hypothetical protein
MTAGVTHPLLAEAFEAHSGIERRRNLRGLSSTVVTGGRLRGLKGSDLPTVGVTARLSRDLPA